MDCKGAKLVLSNQKNNATITISVIVAALSLSFSSKGKGPWKDNNQEAPSLPDAIEHFCTYLVKLRKILDLDQTRAVRFP